MDTSCIAQGIARLSAAWDRAFGRPVLRSGAAAGVLAALALTAVLASPARAAPAPALTGAAPCPLPCRMDLGGSWRFLPGNLQGANQANPASRPPDALWSDIRVPANWYLEGFDVSGVNWYRRQVDLPAWPAGARAVLRFEGVDYFSDVWFNGHYLGSHEGYFEPFAFDVTALLRPGRANELVVRVNSPVEHPSAWSLRKRLIKGIFSHHDTRPGGAWSTRGQERNTGGIWAPVWLQVAQAVALDEPSLRARVAAAGRPTTASLNFTTRAADRAPAQALTAEVELTPHNFQGTGFRSVHTLRVTPGRGEHRLELALPDAQLWWPAELGKPHLYRVRVSLP